LSYGGNEINVIKDLESEVNELPSEPYENEINKDEVRNAVITIDEEEETPDSDKITTEEIKAGGESMVNMLHKMFNVIWRSEDTTNSLK